MKRPIEFLTDLLKKMVSLPDEVKVGDGGQGVWEITANQTDLGVIIGKDGKNIRALKNLVNLKTYKEGLPRVELKIHEESQS